ncbi:hypothetical protein GCM10023333_31180 [Ferrimonas pelagia]|uniref:Uncharacterized protein n=1 Tax=Ferrimonas pelagia TaxID=1177826 RepID=A0ABP9FE23_9GAMM
MTAAAAGTGFRPREFDKADANHGAIQRCDMYASLGPHIGQQLCFFNKNK